MSQSYLDIDLRIESPQGIVFDKSYMRRAMGVLGREVQKEARSLVKHRGGSKPGEYPGQVSGLLARSIQYKVSRPGFLVVVQPRRTAGFGDKEFYPAFLHYGVRAGGRKKNHKKRTDDTAFRIAPRRNYMADALEHKQARVRDVIATAIRDGLGA